MNPLTAGRVAAAILAVAAVAAAACTTKFTTRGRDADGDAAPDVVDDAKGDTADGEGPDAAETSDAVDSADTVDATDAADSADALDGEGRPGGGTILYPTALGGTATSTHYKLKGSVGYGQCGPAAGGGYKLKSCSF